MYVFLFMHNHIEISAYSEMWELERSQAAEVTSKVIQGH